MIWSISGNINTGQADNALAADVGRSGTVCDAKGPSARQGFSASDLICGALVIAVAATVIVFLVMKYWV